MRTRLSTACTVLLLIALAVVNPTSIPAQASDLDQSVYARFNEANLLRGLGNIEESITILDDIIREYADSEIVIRRAYNELIYTLKDADREKDAEDKAREALRLYPDLRVDPAFAPTSMNLMYDELRNQMFGSLRIVEPESCRVFLNGEHVGNTPLLMPYVLTDTYHLEMFKPGFHAYQDTLRINAGGSHDFSYTLHRDRSRAWWLKRIGLGAAAGTVAAVLLLGDDTASEPEPLSDTPPATPW